MDPMLATFDRSFQKLDSRSRELLSNLADANLFEKPREIANSMAMFSVGEYVLRSAAMVEKTFGGITTRLWDDPFEWTLPEKLATKAAIAQYLDEVEATRANGFAFFASDDDLKRQMPAPEKLRPVFEILLETLAIAEHFHSSRQAVSKHIQILTECQLVKQEQTGREIYYYLNARKMKEVADWVEPFRAMWENKYNKLDNVLKNLKTKK